MEEVTCFICNKEKVAITNPYKIRACSSCQKIPPDRLLNNSSDWRRNDALKSHHNEKFRKAKKDKRIKPIGELVK